MLSGIGPARAREFFSYIIPCFQWEVQRILTRGFTRRGVDRGVGKGEGKSR